MRTTARGILAPRIVDEASFRAALRQVSGSVCIVTTGHAPHRHGLTVTAACSLTADPPTVLVCINKSAGAHDTIARTGVFGWNILRPDHVVLAKKFSGQDGSKGDMRFDDDQWTSLVTGVPILVDSPCSFDCRVTGMHAVATHTVFYGAVVAERHRNDGVDLVFRNGGFAVANTVSQNGSDVTSKSE